MNYKYEIPVYQIDDEGDLKFLYNYNTNNIPNVGDIIVNMLQDEQGNFTRRLYFRVLEKQFCTIIGDKGIVNEFIETPCVLNVSAVIDEPVLNL